MFRKLLNSELGRPDVEEYKKIEKIPVTVILDNIRSMHNVGSVFRTCDAFKIKKIILCGITSTPPNPQIHKSALGAEFSVDWEYEKETIEAIKKLKKEGTAILSVEQAVGSTSLEDLWENEVVSKTNIPESKGIALVFGNEVKGVQQEVVNNSDLCVEIPQFGTKHSLNISVSTGVVLWEIMRHYL
ncbi:MAG: RNA methyltransferase [Bacteroidales bacterium]